MGQIMFSRNPTGRIGVGLFLVGISAFLWSVFDALFGPLALTCIGAGLLVAGLLTLRRPQTPHIDPRLVDTPDRPYQPIEPR